MTSGRFNAATETSHDAALRLHLRGLMGGVYPARLLGNFIYSLGWREGSAGW